MLDFVINGGKRKITKPIFIKGYSKENDRLIELESIRDYVTDEKALKDLERQINFTKAGIQGGANVAFELEHSLLPLLCLHDIRLRYEDLYIQLDFVVITQKSIIILETKKMNGDIEITKSGEFNRIFKNKYGKVYKKEGFYSPISQSERHTRILEKILREHKLIRQMPVKAYVIIANPKSIIHKKNSPLSIQSRIFKYDQLTTLLRNEIEDRSNHLNVKEKYLFNIAQFLVEHHQPRTYDYKSKYEAYMNQHTEPVQNKRASINKELDDELLREKLKKYRLDVSRTEGIKAFMVFTNKELEELLKHKPKTKAEIRKIKGFGEFKVENYGEGIVEVFRV